MKLLFSFLLAFQVSTSLFAADNPVDSFVGKYVAEDGSGRIHIAYVIKELCDERAVDESCYKYYLTVTSYDYALYSPEIVRQELAVVEGHKLSFSSSSVCDDPGCLYYDEISGDVSIDDFGEKLINIYYSGWFTYSGEEDEFEFEEEVKFRLVNN